MDNIEIIEVSGSHNCLAACGNLADLGTCGLCPGEEAYGRDRGQEKAQSGITLAAEVNRGDKDIMSDNRFLSDSPI